MKVTNHARERGKERVGLNHAAFKGLAETAFTVGIKHSDTTGRLKKYLDALYFANPNVPHARIYGEFVYLFSRDNALVTVMHLPNQFRAIANKIKNRS